MRLLNKRFTIAEYHNLYDQGILTEDDRTELLRGEIYHMSPVGRRHASCVKRLNHLFKSIFEQEVIIIGVQDPVILNDASEPQPDIALLRWQDDFYLAGHPTPADILLLIEVADSTAGIDKANKLPLYAENGIVESWLVDLNQQWVEVHRAPAIDGYQDVQVFQPGQSVSVPAFAKVAIAVDQILGLSAINAQS
jgi:Uma2 family endonuclease